MEFANLRAFVAVAETCSFSEAAEVLYLTQPAVSKRVKTLETDLEAPLFDRIGRRVSLTEAGAALLPRARRILLEIEDSRRALTHLSGEVHGTLRVGTSHHIGLHRLPPVLRDFVRHYPQVRLDLRFMDSEAACQAVEHGDLELAVVTLPPGPIPALELTPVWPDPLAVVAAPDHVLSQRDPVAVADLAAHPAVLPSAGTYTRQIAEQALGPYGIELNVELSTNYLETIKMLVEVGLGWSILPRSMLDADLVEVAVSGLRLQRALGLVRHRARTLSNAASRLIELLLQDQGESAGQSP